MTLIADPLYNPFKENPQVNPARLPPRLLMGASWQPLPTQHQTLNTAPTPPLALPEEVPFVPPVQPTVAPEDITETLVPGDFNRDSVVDANDLGLLSDAIDSRTEDMGFDVTGDGKVDSADLIHESNLVTQAMEEAIRELD